jgi:hypothetical protein
MPARRKGEKVVKSGYEKNWQRMAAENTFERKENQRIEDREGEYLGNLANFE